MERRDFQKCRRMVSSLNRVIDANFNRAKEGLRVCEDIVRFFLNSRSLTARFKDVRHRMEEAARLLAPAAALLEARDASGDAGMDVAGREFSRRDMRDVFFANIQRVKESMRVLEEFSKLSNVEAARAFKRLRYDIYDAEKKAAEKVAALYHT